MAKEWATPFYASSQWKKCQATYVAKRISIDGGLCEMCKSEQGYICHHVIHLTHDNINDVSISLNHNNLQYLCPACHRAIHGGKSILKCYRFTPDGDLIKR